jgi:multidrug efflux pump subunit AcrA (membrane-fusion protein)
MQRPLRRNHRNNEAPYQQALDKHRREVQGALSALHTELATNVQDVFAAVNAERDAALTAANAVLTAARAAQAESNAELAAANAELNEHRTALAAKMIECDGVREQLATMIAKFNAIEGPILQVEAIKLARSRRTRLTPGDYLRPGEYLTTGEYFLVLQHDGNLVLYRGHVALWSSGTAGKDAREVIFQHDGNIVLYGHSNVAYWSTGTGGRPTTQFVLQEDSNLVAYADGEALWHRMQ